MPSWATRREITIAPGRSMPYVAEEWEDTLVLLMRGSIELECHAGGRRRFPPGAVLWFVDLDVHTIHNAGEELVRIVAVSRRDGVPPADP
jgi:uncharacterized cupin superfamily protein